MDAVNETNTNVLTNALKFSQKASEYHHEDWIGVSFTTLPSTVEFDSLSASLLEFQIVNLLSEPRLNRLAT